MAIIALPGLAQEQRGAIEGTVTDTAGGLVPGATVTARSAAGTTQTAVTSTTGRYSFPSLAPGTYEITAQLPGFTTVKMPDIRLSLGQALKVDLTLKVSTVEETITVTGESPVVDVSQTTRAVAIRDEFVDKLPKGRDYTTLATQAPGVNFEFKTGGVSIDGATGTENKYIIDGVDTSDPNRGLASQQLVTDMVDEVQVKSSGYAAEYSGAVGGVINVVTKSGTNDFKGSAWTYFSGDALGYARGAGIGGSNQAPAYTDGRPTLRLSPTNSLQSEYITYNEDAVDQWEPGFALGGPIKKDKAWFFVSYNPTLRTITRDVTLSYDGSRASGEEKRTTHFLTANISTQPSDAVRARFAFNSNNQTVEGLLPAANGSELPGIAYGDLTTKFPNWSSTFNLDYVASSKLFFSGRVGYFMQDTQTEGNFQGDRYLYSNSNLGGCSGCPPIPAAFQGPTGFSNTTAALLNETVRDKFTRLSLAADFTWFLEAGGTHNIKGGVQYDDVSNDVLTQETNNLIQLLWGRSLSGQRGAYGYYRVRTNNFEPSRGFMTVGDTASKSLGFFLQDSWNISQKLTLNLGVRTERERVPNYDPTNPASVAAGYGETLFEFGFDQKLAPRLGFAYDLKGDGKTKVFGSWGLFYDIMKLQMPRGSFGGDKWIELYYTLDSPNPAALNGCQLAPSGSGGVNCPGNLIRQTDFRYPSFDYLAPYTSGEFTLDPYKVQEWSGGIEHTLTTNSSIALRYVHKQIDRAIEDIGYLNETGDEVYIIGNPGYGANEIAWRLNDGTEIAAAKAVRDYDGVEVVFNRRLSNRWALRASYLWSRLYGNYTGLAQGDESGRTSPNVGRNFDAPFMMSDQTGKPTFGPLPTDHPHQGKAQFIYEAPFGLTVGLNAYVASGVPVTREAAFIQGYNYSVQYLGRESDGRTPTYSNFDLNLVYEFKIGDKKKLQFMANILNLFDQETSISRFPVETSAAAGVAVDITEEQFFRGFDGQALVNAAGPKDPRFLRDAQFQDPRQIRLGARLIF
ncbi:MAG: TonB-dependent receptor [Vicinamibacteria bacterium]|nr:TonB-dependent receptor [Vicinamibacteria bacterium]